jgi:cytochrome c oxidase assembly protein subunit 15
LAVAILAERKLGKSDALARFALFWLGLIIIQIAFGMWTIWSNKAADIATLHVLIGALSLMTGAMGCIIAFRRSLRMATDGARNANAMGVLGKLAANK